MNPIAMQRLSVRMLYDWSLTTAIYDTGTDPILGVEVPAPARATLTRPPRELWRSDPYRQGRMVTALLRVFTATCAWTFVRAPDRPLTDFFLSIDFHRSIDARTSTVRAFGEWLSSTFCDLQEVASLAQLERALDDVRHARAPLQREPSASWSISPHARVLEVSTGTSDVLHATHQRLEAHPISATHAAVHGEWDGGALTIHRTQKERLLVHHEPNGVANISRISDPLYELLAALSSDGPHATLLAVAAEHGASAEDLDDLMRDLGEDGVVVHH